MGRTPVQDAVDACASALVVLGHSYRGSAVTGLRGVHHLVFVAAFVPESGESSASLGGPEPLMKAALIRYAARATHDTTREEETECAEWQFIE